MNSTRLFGCVNDIFGFSDQMIGYYFQTVSCVNQMFGGGDQMFGCHYHKDGRH